MSRSSARARTVPTAGVLVVMAMAIAGCGDGDGADVTAPRNTDATATAEEAGPNGADAAAAGCPLTAEQVTAVLGIDMAPRGTGCSFAASGSTFAEVYYSGVPLDVFVADEATAVDGVGDEAYLGPSDELYVRDGDRGFSIHVLASESSSGVDGGAAQIELAELVIDAAG